MIKTRIQKTAMGDRKLYIVGPIAIHLTGGVHRGAPILPNIKASRGIVIFQMQVPRRFAFHGNDAIKISNMINVWVQSANHPNVRV